MLAQWMKDGKAVPVGLLSKEIQELLPNEDKHRATASLHRTLATNIYKTKDGRFYHTHGELSQKGYRPELSGVVDIHLLTMSAKRKHESRTDADRIGTSFGRRTR